MAVVFYLTGKTSVSQNLTVNGYVKDLFVYYKLAKPLPFVESDHLSHNLLHNRINIKWYASQKLTFALDIRNRVFSGQMIREFPEYQSFIDQENRFIDLSVIPASGNGWFIHSIADRAWVDFTSGKWQITAGRQRINWGINLVWNPNDIFNTFSWFDFDYEERPGSDAVRVQWYTSATSSAEVAFKAGNSPAERAAAARYRFLWSGYDLQIICGQAGNDFVFGGGWAGDINGGGFRGEASWFIPRKNQVQGTEAFVASLSGDYTLKNSLYLHGGFLFNSNGTTGKAGGRSFFEQDLSAKLLSLGRYNLFGQISYPLTPLINAGMSVILNPSDRSAYTGPTITWNAADNLELMFTAQWFTGKPGTEYGDYGKAGYVRIKWAF